jgi:plasmid stabilization system protein ParE
VARKPVKKRPQAIRDLADIALYLAEESGNDELGFRFLDAAEEGFEQLADMPGMGSQGNTTTPISRACACGASLAFRVT